MAEPEHETRVHRALSSPVRRQILAVLRAADRPPGVHELAEQLGVHVNTVRAHLTVLGDAGLVASQPEDRGGPGRPRLTYRAAPAATGDDGQRDYRFLAEILASYLAATVADPTAAAERAGEAWGHHLVDRPPPFQAPEPSAAVDRVVAMLDDLGFAPERDDGDPTAPRLLLHRCPFLDVAREHQEVVCGIHLGLMRGALEQLGSRVEVRDLLPFVEADRCISHLGLPA